MSADKPQGVLLIVSAPSGAGKTSLVAALLDQDPKLRVSVSHTTRPRRPAETDGVNYHFVSEARFDQLAAADGFLEHARVFGNAYGTTRQTVAEHFAADCDVILEIDWQGATQVRSSHPDAVSIFILPPSIEVLRERLQQRGQDAPDVVEKRLAEARRELEHATEFDYLVVNDNFAMALAELQAIVEAERCRTRHASQSVKQLLDSLLSGI